MKHALREFTGAGGFLGVWVWDDAAPNVEPELAYRQGHAASRMDAENRLADYAPTPSTTWLEVLQYHADKAHWQYRRFQGPFETELSAPELLAQTEDELRKGVPIEGLSGIAA